MIREPQVNRRQVSGFVSIPAPIRGLNFRDPLAGMKPTDALVLDNVVCRPDAVEVMKGNAAGRTGFPAPVETLMGYTTTSGGYELWAAAGTAFYNATGTGAIGAAVVTGLTSAYWQSLQFSNTAGNWLIAVNGADDARIYNGTTWAALGVTGVPINTLRQAAVWKRRLWFVANASMTAWYLPVDAVAGAAVAFPLQGIFKRGGRLQAIINWSLDGGDGLDDYLVFVSSEGEVAIYRGTDPAAAATFTLQGVYFVGKPIGERFWAQLGGEIVMLTGEGLIPLSKYLSSATVDRTQLLTYRIQDLISREITAFGTSQGWEVHIFFDRNILLIQVPAGSIGSRYQYCMNLITGAWSRLLKRGAATFCVQGRDLYAGEATRTVNAWTGGLEDGQPIRGVIIPAFSYFGSAARRKRFTLGRLTIQSDLQPSTDRQLLVEFDLTYQPYSGSTPSATGALWDVALWDSAVWGSELQVYRSWYSLSGIGYAATQAVQFIHSGTDWRLIALDYVFEPGGLL